MSTSKSSSNRTPVQPVADPVDAALIAAFQAHTGSTPSRDLHAAVCAYVQRRRDAGALAADLVIDVKRLMALADTRGPRSPERRELVGQVVTMCIAEYYRAD
jgi:hypothetical protein